MKKDPDRITLDEGAGGQEMQRLVDSFRDILGTPDRWEGCGDDAAVYDMGDKKLVFTTDSYTVDPLFFAGGNIGHLAISGTINDLVVMGAEPLGLSLALIIEEGLERERLQRIMYSIQQLSQETGVPVTTGDTKVMQKGKVDGLMINTSGIGQCTPQQLLVGDITEGDAVILSGGLGEHAVALLSHRFEFETELKTDSAPLINEMSAIRPYIRLAKDPTRGGIAATLNEIAHAHGKEICIDEGSIPMKREVRTVTDMLGLDPYQLACEGRLVCVCDQSNAQHVLSLLRQFNADAAQIGTINGSGQRVVVRTSLGSRILPVPTGRIVPRIC